MEFAQQNAQNGKKLESLVTQVKKKKRSFSVRIILLKKLTTKRNRWLISLEAKRDSRNCLGEKMSFSQTLFLDESVQDSWPLMVVLMIYRSKGS